MPEELIERLAAVQHEIWAHWMRYLFSVSVEDTTSGWVVIPAEKVARWKRQVETAYADLSEREKESDREQARKVLAVLAQPTRPNVDETGLWARQMTFGKAQLSQMPDLEK